MTSKYDIWIKGDLTYIYVNFQIILHINRTSIIDGPKRFWQHVAIWQYQIFTSGINPPKQPGFAFTRTRSLRLSIYLNHLGLALKINIIKDLMADNPHHQSALLLTMSLYKSIKHSSMCNVSSLIFSLL